jgi:hypothetical protein
VCLEGLGQLKNPVTSSGIDLSRHWKRCEKSGPETKEYVNVHSGPTVQQRDSPRDVLTSYGVSCFLRQTTFVHHFKTLWRRLRRGGLKQERRPRQVLYKGFITAYKIFARHEFLFICFTVHIVTCKSDLTRDYTLLITVTLTSQSSLHRLETKFKSKSHCDWRSVTQLSLSVEPHLGLMTRYLLQFDSYGLASWGALSNVRTVVFCICCWPLPAQSSSGPSPLGLATIFYCLRFETSRFVASCDSQGHGGGIRPRLHTGRNWSSKHGLAYNPSARTT